MLWRHGQTTWNVEHRFQGQTDIPLDETGEAQAEQAARRLATLRPDALFSSDLTRAQQTAAPLARLTGLPVTLDKDLRERFGGDWEGLSDKEIRERYPAERATWNPPNGEPTSVVADRVAGAFTRIAETLADGQLRSWSATARRCASAWSASWASPPRAAPSSAPWSTAPGRSWSSATLTGA